MQPLTQSSTRSAPRLALKRIYEPPSPGDGRRILVDRLWPRGVSKARAHLDSWMKDVAPTTELRRWFDHRPERWPEFRRRYLEELASNRAVPALEEMVATGPVTLLYAARAATQNEAVVLAEYILSASEKPSADIPGEGRDRPG